MHLCSYHRAVIPSNFVQIVDLEQLAKFGNVSDVANPLFEARAQYACMRSQSPFLRMNMLILTITAADTADPLDPNEISFSKGEILDIIDNTEKWWRARKQDGTSGST
jgi:hypothetical protein